jgi:hypothetical protein
MLPAAKRPGSQKKHCDDPAGANVPATHLAHDLSWLRLTGFSPLVPTAQSSVVASHVAFTVFSLMMAIPVNVSQLVAAVSRLAVLPGAHTVQKLAPEPDVVPATQSKHGSSSLWFCGVVYGLALPAAQLTHELLT